nr:sulfite exporter TauE/SafE family protein [Mesobacterium pallidum]
MAVAVTILGLSKGGFAGIGMVSTPLVALVIDPITAVGLMLPIMLVQDGVAIWLYRQSFDASLLKVLIPGGALGVGLAYLLASSVPPYTVKAVLGVISVSFALWQLAQARRGRPLVALRARGAADAALGVAAGAASGFTSAIAHAGPPPFQVYVMPRGLTKEVYVGTSVMFFACVNLMKLPSFGALGLFSAESLKVSAVFIPLAVVASWAGARLVRVVNPDTFRTLITLILLGIGCVLLAQAGVEAFS